MDKTWNAYDELYAYAMERPGFILQHVADAFAVQSADAETKPIGVVFGLAGLYLRVEKQFTGREVQKAHATLAQRKREWPKLKLPRERGAVTVAKVMAAEAGVDRDRAIDDWCKSVWTACSENRELLVELLGEYRVL